MEIIYIYMMNLTITSEELYLNVAKASKNQAY